MIICREQFLCQTMLLPIQLDSHLVSVVMRVMSNVNLFKVFLQVITSMYNKNCLLRAKSYNIYLVNLCIFHNIHSLIYILDVSEYVFPPVGFTNLVLNNKWQQLF